MSEDKEPSYFVEPETLKVLWPAMYAKRYWENLENYLSLFAGAGQARWIGESSTNYSKLPVSADIAERIHRFAPDAKILYLMRDPAHRALSHYWQSVDREFEQAAPEHALVPGSHYFDVSHYAMQLRPYLSLFPRDSVMVLSLEEFEAEPDRVFGAILRWLAVSSVFRPANLGEKFHQTPSILWQTRAGRLARFYRKISVPKFIRRLCPDAMRYYAWRLAVKPVRRDPTSETALMARVREWQRPQIRELEDLLGRRFPEWVGNP